VSHSVLFLHHYANFGGASKSLLELIRAFPPAEVVAHVIVPRGRVSQLFSEHGIPVITTRRVALFDNTRYSYYRGVRWAILIREFAALPWVILALMRARRLWTTIDIIHVNEITLLPTAILAKWIFRVPMVVHVRAVQSTRKTLRSRAVAKLLRKFSAAIIAIDQTVGESLPRGLPVHVVHNSLAISSRASQTGERGRPFTVAMVGTLQRAKGCLEFVQAAAICKDRGLKVRFLLVGESARKPKGILQSLLNAVKISQEIEPELRAYIAEKQLETYVELQGFRADIENVYQSIDAVCFPSYYDAPGRPIFEAAMFGLPSIAAISNPTPDTFVPGTTGLSIPAGDPVALADAIEKLSQNPTLCRSLGAEARRLALSNCDPIANAGRVLSIYRDVLHREGR